VGALREQKPLPRAGVLPCKASSLDALATQVTADGKIAWRARMAPSGRMQTADPRTRAPACSVARRAARAKLLVYIGEPEA
jgi:hypothetical protein